MLTVHSSLQINGIDVVEIASERVEQLIDSVLMFH